MNIEKKLDLPPHLMYNGQEKNGKFYFDTLCLVDGCGVTINEKYLKVGDYLGIELSIKDNIIQMQTLLLRLQGLMLRDNKILTSEDRELKNNILKEIVATNQIHRTVLENNFSPGVFDVKGLLVTEKVFTYNELISLLNNDNRVYPHSIEILNE